MPPQSKKTKSSFTRFNDTREGWLLGAVFASQVQPVRRRDEVSRSAFVTFGVKAKDYLRPRRKTSQALYGLNFAP